MDTVPFWPERATEGSEIAAFVRERLRASHNNILYVCGNCGCGKTSTVLHLQKFRFDHDLHGARNPVFSHINCADLGAAEVLKRIHTALYPRKAIPSRLDGLRRAVRSAIDSPTDLTKLPVLVLDEVEAANQPGAAELKRVVELSLSHGAASVAVIIISNSKELFHVDRSRITSITFRPYTLAELRAIAARWADTNGVELSAGAIDWAAKTVLNVHNADLRKLAALCSHGNARVRSRDDVGGTQQAKPRQPSGRPLTPANPNTSQVQQKAQVSVSDVRNSTNDAPSTNVPIIQTLPQQMLLLLCALWCASGTAKTLTVHAAHNAFQRAAAAIGTNMTSVNETRTLLHNLVDLGLISVGKNEMFALCVHRSEMDDALKGEGSALDIARTVVKRL